MKCDSLHELDPKLFWTPRIARIAKNDPGIGQIEKSFRLRKNIYAKFNVVLTTA